MRIFPLIAVVLVGMAALAPAALAAPNECGARCTRVTVPNTPSTPERVYYVTTDGCAHVAPYPCPPGGTRDQGPRVLGAAWQETNGVPGLQRHAGLDYGTDTPVLL